MAWAQKEKQFIDEHDCDCGGCKGQRCHLIVDLDNSTGKNILMNNQFLKPAAARIESILGAQRDETISQIGELLFRLKDKLNTENSIGIAQDIVKECFNMPRSISDDYSHICGTIIEDILRKML